MSNPKNNLGANLTSVTESTGDAEEDKILGKQSNALLERAKALQSSTNKYDRDLGILLEKGVDLALTRAKALKIIESSIKGESVDPINLLNAQDQLERLDIDNLDIITSTILNRLNKQGLNIELHILQSYINISTTLGYFYYIEDIENPPQQLDRIKGIRSLENSIKIEFIISDLLIQSRIIKALAECGMEFQQFSILIKGIKKQADEIPTDFKEGSYRNYGEEGFELPITDTFEYTINLVEDFLNIDELEKKGVNVNDLYLYFSSLEFRLELGKILTRNRFMGATFHDLEINLMYIPQFDSRSTEQWENDFKNLVKDIIKFLKLDLNIDYKLRDSIIDLNNLEKIFIKVLVVSFEGKSEGFVPYSDITSDEIKRKNTRMLIIKELSK